MSGMQSLKALVWSGLVWSGLHKSLFAAILLSGLSLECLNIS